MVATANYPTGIEDPAVLNKEKFTNNRSGVESAAENPVVSCEPSSSARCPTANCLRAIVAWPRFEQGKDHLFECSAHCWLAGMRRPFPRNPRGFWFILRAKVIHWRMEISFRWCPMATSRKGTVVVRASEIECRTFPWWLLVYLVYSQIQLVLQRAL
jgi:hypothetical protein